MYAREDGVRSNGAGHSGQTISGIPGARDKIRPFGLTDSASDALLVELGFGIDVGLNHARGLRCLLGQRKRRGRQRPEERQDRQRQPATRVPGAGGAKSAAQRRSRSSQTRRTGRRRPIHGRQPHHDRHIDPGVAQVQPGESEGSVGSLQSGPQRGDRKRPGLRIRTKPMASGRRTGAMCRPLRTANSRKLTQLKGTPSPP